MVRMISSMGRGHFRFVAGGASALTFTPAWKSILIGGGGFIQSVIRYPGDVIMSHGDTFGPWLLDPGVAVTGPGGTTYAAPAHRDLITATTLPSAKALQITAFKQLTTAWAMAAAPSNVNVLYSFYGNDTSLGSTLYYSTDRGFSWRDSGVTQTSFQPNGATYAQHSPMAVDPINPDVVYLVTPSSGVRRTFAGSSGGSWSLISTATLPAATSSAAGCVAFDTSLGSTGGKTNRILIGINGSGMYESTDAGSTWNIRSTGTPPTFFYHMMVDSFGQVWNVVFAVDGYVNSHRVYKYSGGTWSKLTGLGADVTTNYLCAIFQDPSFSGSQANNQMIALEGGGNGGGGGSIWGTKNNGTTWTAIAPANQSMQSISPQPGWVHNTMTYATDGLLVLNFGNADIDSTGTIWGGSGIDMFTTPNPWSGTTFASSALWSANMIGQDQLVGNQMISVLNGKPFLGVWDRGVYTIENVDTFAASQYPNQLTNPNAQNLSSGWSIDNAYGTFTAISTLTRFGNEIFGVTTDAHTWGAAANLPPIMIEASLCAASTATHWICAPNNGAAAIVYYTLNGASTAWSTSTLAGSPSPIVSDYTANRRSICADRVTADTYYFVDQAQKIFKSTNGGANFSATGATVSAGNGSQGIVYSDEIFSIPPLGGAATAGHLAYHALYGQILFSHDGGATWPTNSGTLDAVWFMGFGAPPPGGTYPTIYALQSYQGTLANGLYKSTNQGTTWSLISAPASEQLFPNHVLDFVGSISGDYNVYGRIYACFRGSTATYIDTSDAVPYVNFTVATAKPNQNFTGTVTITAEHSGLVPVASVQFSVDGANIGAPLTGQSTYSVSWNTAGVAHGAHTLTVTTTGANGSASFAIPITTS